jgi:hypothetical protein
MAEGKASGATITALTGHMSRKRMERYTHAGERSQKGCDFGARFGVPKKSPQLESVDSSDDEQVVNRSGAPGRIRTSDPLVRSQMLYPTELRAHIAWDATF